MGVARASKEGAVIKKVVSAGDGKRVLADGRVMHRGGDTLPCDKISRTDSGPLC